MITPWAIYLILQLDSIINFFSAVVFISSLITVGILIPVIYAISESQIELYKKLKPFLINSVISLAIFSIIFTLIPSTKTALAMYTIPDILNNKKVQAIPDKALDLINQKLDEYLKHK